MPVLPDFRLETYFSKWEFAARYHLTASDSESMALSELLAMASDETKAQWDSLRLGYTETWGLPALRAAIAGTYSEITADQVLCFAGAEEGIYVAMQTLLQPSDHAIVITPNYQAAETIPLSICDVTGVALRDSEDWALDLDDLIAAIRPDTRLISVNFPNNPTGAMPSEAVWRRLAQICDEREIILFSDEVYRGLETSPLPQAADISPRGISLNVMSKAYGFPGLRVGWIACQDRSVLERLERAKHYTTICNSAPSEILALIGLEARDRILARNKSIIAANIPVFDSFFARFPDLFEWAPPRGGCVCFPRYLGSDGVEAMCTDLVEQEGVLLLPASIYASSLTPTPADRFRLGLGRKSPEAALDRWATWLDKRP